MKKMILSGVLVIIFVTYAYFQKPSDASDTAVIPSSVVTPTATQQATPTPSTAASTPVQSQPTNSPKSTPTLVSTKSGYKDGTYTGDSEDAFYGNVQVQATISNGKITDVQFLQYPNDQGRSIEVNSYAMPYLKQEAIAVQSANVQIVSGATATSQAFAQSLQSALSQAKG